MNALSLPGITYAEAFAFLRSSSQASIYISKRYMDPLINAFEHIKLVSGIAASELKRNKPGVQHHCKWQYFSSSRSASGWRLCFVEQKSWISWERFPSPAPCSPQPTSRVPGAARPEAGRTLHSCPGFIIQSLSIGKVRFADWVFFVSNSAGCLIFL